MACWPPEGQGRAAGVLLMWLGLNLLLAGQTASADTNPSRQSFRIQPVEPVALLEQRALAASPPAESGDFLPPDLVDPTQLHAGILLDIRYATTNNFLATRIYRQARAFLQRPAAEALVRAHQRLQRHGYGLLLYDAYRPWYVTRIFWDATPAQHKVFVADPQQGSRHNRGCAVDLTLYDLASGQALDMPSGYDEFSERAHADYSGGSETQRRHRDLLRQAMEAEGFTVYPEEWWHYDCQGWQRYPIMNLRFEELDPSVTKQ